MSEPFATVDDLEAGWRTLDATERATAETLLARASRIIRSTCPRWNTYETAEPGTCSDICCDMVKRAMLNPDAAGVTQTSQTAGSFSESFTYSNPSGDLYMTSAEKRRLGVGVGRAFTVKMTGEESS